MFAGFIIMFLSTISKCLHYYLSQNHAKVVDMQICGNIARAFMQCLYIFNVFCTQFLHLDVLTASCFLPEHYKGLGHHVPVSQVRGL